MKRVWCSVVVFFLSMPTFVSAAIPTDLVPCGDADQASCQTCHIYALVENVFAWLFGVGALITAIIIIYGGFRMVTSQGNQEAKREARKRISAALIGLILIGSAWFLIDLLIATLAGEPDASGLFSAIECVAQP